MATKRTMYERTMDKGLAINNVAKALAYFVFRELVEDAHAKYRITDEEMMEMNKQAVNRAAAFLECIGNDEKLVAFASLYALQTTGWDNPKETADTRSFHKMADEVTEALRSTKGKTNSELYGDRKEPMKL